MLSKKRFIVATICAFVAVPPGRLCAVQTDHLEFHEILTTAELQAASGGVMGAKVGRSEHGLLEMSCGYMDTLPSAETQSWWPLSGTYFRCNQVVPRYNSRQGIMVLVSADITSYQDPTLPSVKLYLNGTQIDTFRCGLMDQTIGPGPFVVGAAGYQLYPRTCPGAGGGRGWEVALPVELIKTGGNPNVVAVKAAPSGGSAMVPYEDIEFRLFYVDCDTCDDPNC